MVLSGMGGSSLLPSPLAKLILKDTVFSFSSSGKNSVLCLLKIMEGWMFTVWKKPHLVCSQVRRPQSSDSSHRVEENLETGSRNGLSTNPVPVVPLNPGLALTPWWAHLKPHSHFLNAFRQQGAPKAASVPPGAEISLFLPDCASRLQSGCTLKKCTGKTHEN